MLKIASCLTSAFLYCFSVFICKAESNLFTSAIVVNSNNGKILYSYNADKKIYPASLTKMMTAYIVFEKITQGVIGLYDTINIDNYRNANLHNMFPNQKQITIRDLLIKIIVNSKNTPAEILALEIYGNTKSFVAEMNKKAKQFGMTGTHFVNTHGLFNENHYSTARDIANISIRLISDFPEYAELFNITEYIDNEDEIETKTSTIQKNIKGVKGSKTGYISASGYNIAMWGLYENGTTKPDNIFAVLIGAKSKQQRDELILKLLNATIKKEFNKDNNAPNTTNYLDDIMNFFGVKPEIYKAHQPTKRQTISKYNNLDDFNDNDNVDVFDNQSFELPNDYNEEQDENKLEDKILVQNKNKIFEADNKDKQNNKFEMSVKPNSKKKNRFYIAR